jgi:hypothetical protein
MNKIGDKIIKSSTIKLCIHESMSNCRWMIYFNDPNMEGTLYYINVITTI